MEVLFENVTEYDDQEIKKFMKFNEKINQPYAKYLLVVCVLFMIIAIMNIVFRNWKGLIAQFVLFGILYLYYFRVKPKQNQEQNKKMIHNQYTFRFYDRFLKVKEARAQDEKLFNYIEISRIYETKENFYLYVGDNCSLLINKTNFTIGNLSDFREFIKRKCILKYRKMYRIEKPKPEDEHKIKTKKNR